MAACTIGMRWTTPVACAQVDGTFVVNAYDATFVGLGGIEGYVSANRVVIVIDKNGVVQHRWVAENPGVEPDYDAVVALAASL